MSTIWIACLAFVFTMAAYADPLPSWQDGHAKRSIIDFVQTVTDKSSSRYVVPEDRIAAIDNDGTLWVEQPLYTQFIFSIDRVKALSPNHPEWKKQKPFKFILENNTQALAKLTLDDFKKILVVTHAGMTVEDYHKMAAAWLATAKNPRFKHLYKEDIYQPMLEVMNYLRDNNFRVYIVTGGGQDFVRAYAEQTYGVVPEQVIGTLAKTQYVYQQKKPVLIKMPEVLFINDRAGKPEAIDFFIGRKPIITFGNSDGDRQMLEWTQSGNTAHLMLLVHHDDAVREYAYDAQSKIGTFSASLMAEAKQNNWEIISMKNDWKTIFPFESS